MNIKYPLLILLHGYTGSESSWFSYSRCEMYAEENNIAIVSIAGENKWYINTDKDKYYDFLEYELKDYLYGNFNISNKRSDNYIAGLSMGGYGALIHALKNPERYNKVGAFSPKIYMKYKDLLSGKELQDLASLNKSIIPGIYISMGSFDSLISETDKYVRFLNKNKIDNDYSVIEGFGHEWRLWDTELEKFIKSLDRTDEAIEYAPHGV